MRTGEREKKTHQAEELRTVPNPSPVAMLSLQKHLRQKDEYLALVGIAKKRKEMLTEFRLGEEERRVKSQLNLPSFFATASPFPTSFSEQWREVNSL